MEIDHGTQEDGDQPTAGTSLENSAMDGKTDAAHSLKTTRQDQLSEHDLLHYDEAAQQSLPNPWWNEGPCENAEDEPAHDVFTYYPPSAPDRSSSPRAGRKRGREGFVINSKEPPTKKHGAGSKNRGTGTAHPQSWWRVDAQPKEYAPIRGHYACHRAMLQLGADPADLTNCTVLDQKWPSKKLRVLPDREPIKGMPKQNVDAATLRDRIKHAHQGYYHSDNDNSLNTCSFVTFNAPAGDEFSTGAMIDSGASSSIVGKKTLDATLNNLKIERLQDARPMRVSHRFGTNPERFSTICAVSFPFRSTDQAEPLFNIQFDVIEGDLPFLVGLPSLLSMRASLNFNLKWLGIITGEGLDSYIKLNLVQESGHILLPFEATLRRDEKRRLNFDKSSYYTAPESNYPDEEMDGARSERTIVSGYYAPNANHPWPTYPSDDVEPARPAACANEESLVGTNEESGPGLCANSEEAWLNHVRSCHGPTMTNDHQCLTQAPSTNSDQSVTESHVHHYRTIRDGRKLPNLAEIKKIHIQLKHATAAQLEDYLRVAGLWMPEMKEDVLKVLNSCPCKLGENPRPHPIVGSSPPTKQIQTDVSVDVITVSGIPFMHVVDHGTNWSETAMLRSHALQDQVRTIKQIQLYRHGIPKSITADGEYGKGDFNEMCDEFNIKLIVTPAHAHQSNGKIERANRTIRSFYNRLRACHPNAPTVDLMVEATFAKNICRGQQIASSFELLYGRSPLLEGTGEPARETVPTMADAAAHSARRKINLMLRKNLREPEDVNTGDMVYIWRDNGGWIGPAPVLEATTHGVIVRHNNRQKTASRNRVRRILPLQDDECEVTPKVPLPGERPTAKVHALDATDLVAQEEKNCDAEPAQHVHDAQAPPEPRNPGRINDFNNNDDGKDANNGGPAVDTKEDVSTQATDHGQPSPENDAPPCNEKEVCPDPVQETQKVAAGPPASAAAHARLKKDLADVIDEQERHFGADKAVGRTRSETRAALTKKATDVIAESQVDHSTMATVYADAILLSNTEKAGALTQLERAKAFKRELDTWVRKAAFERVDKKDVPLDANIIGSHTVYRKKDDGSVKARIVPWVHRDPARFELRCDPPCLNPDIFHLVLSMAAELKWRIAQMDAEAAFLQAQGFSRKIYVRPPKEAGDPDGLWLLLAAAYGLADSGRLWYRTNDDALVNLYHLTCSKYEPTLCYHRDDHGKLDFILAVQVDNYLYSGTPKELTRFESFLQTHFKIGSLERTTFPVLGCELQQSHDHSIQITQQARASGIDTGILTRSVDRSEKDRLATSAEISAYRSVIGQCLYIGRLTNPVLQYHCSKMASKVSSLHTRHLKTLKSIVNSQTKTPPQITYNPAPDGAAFSLQALSDASMSTAIEAARGGFIIFRRCGDTVHPIYWSARKLRRVARSSSTAELLAASDATNALAYLQCLLNEVHYHHAAETTVDSRALYDLSTTVHEPAEPLNKVDLSFIRQLFVPTKVGNIAWVPGHYNVSDALTKNNTNSAALLLKVLQEGKYPHHPDRLVRTAEQPLLGNDENNAQTGEC